MSENKTTSPESDDPLEPAAPTEPPHPYKPTDDREEIYFQGSPLIRGEIGMVTLWAVAGRWTVGWTIRSPPPLPTTFTVMSHPMP